MAEDALERVPHDYGSYFPMSPSSGTPAPLLKFVVWARAICAVLFFAAGAYAVVIGLVIILTFTVHPSFWNGITEPSNLSGLVVGLLVLAVLTTPFFLVAWIAGKVGAKIFPDWRHLPGQDDVWQTLVVAMDHGRRVWAWLSKHHNIQIYKAVWRYARTLIGLVLLFGGLALLWLFYTAYTTRGLPSVKLDDAFNMYAIMAAYLAAACVAVVAGCKLSLFYRPKRPRFDTPKKAPPLRGVVN